MERGRMTCAAANRGAVDEQDAGIPAVGAFGTAATGAWCAGLDDVVVPGTVAEKLADGFKFTEGATVNAAGRSFSWTSRTTRSFGGPASRACGPSWIRRAAPTPMCFAADGTLLVCADERMELWSVTPDGKVTVLAKDMRATNSTARMTCGRVRRCYFTDPFYKRPWWTHKDAPQGTQQVYFLPKGACLAA